MNTPVLIIPGIGNSSSGYVSPRVLRVWAGSRLWLFTRLRNVLHYMTLEEAAGIGIAPGLLRISVGPEGQNDLIADFEQSLTNSSTDITAKGGFGHTQD